MNRRSSYLPSLPQHNLFPLPGISSNDDTDMMIGESIGFRPTDFTSGSASSNNNTRNNPILSSSLYDDPMSSRTAGRPSDYFWLNSSPPTPADQNSMDPLQHLRRTLLTLVILPSPIWPIPSVPGVGASGDILLPR